MFYYYFFIFVFLALTRAGSTPDFSLKWVDDTHALAIYSNSYAGKLLWNLIKRNLLSKIGFSFTKVVVKLLKNWIEVNPRKTIIF